MKSKHVFILLGFALIVSSCGKEEICKDTELNQIIVGIWDLNALGINTGEVEFMSDGTLIDPNNTLVRLIPDGVTIGKKTYTIESDTILVTRAKNNNHLLKSEWIIKDFSCDEITIEFLGFSDATLIRK